MRITLHALVISIMVSSTAFAADSYKESKGKKEELIEVFRDGNCDKVRGLTGTSDVSLPIDEAFHLAIGLNANGVAKLLLQHGAPVNKRFEGVLPLWRAADNGDETMIVRLLDAGAHLHAISNDGDTAFHRACLKGHLKAAMELKKRGASLVARNLKDATPLHCAVVKGDVGVVELLLPESELDVQDAQGRTPLLIALVIGQESIASKLLDAGANPNISGPEGFTPLHMAASRKSKKAVVVLIEKEADPLAKSKAGLSPLDLTKDEEIRDCLEDAIKARQQA